MFSDEFIVDYWHIEPTSRCFLSCANCSRGYLNSGLQNDINPDQLFSFFQQMKTDGKGAKMAHLSGNLGDPIYHPDLFQIIRKLKSLDIKILMTTNGSKRGPEWWRELTTLLGKEDSLSLSIDGLEDTNSLYRQGSDWKSLESALNIIGQANVQSTWKYIVFSHNQHQIERAKDFAKKKNIDHFALVKSNQWFSIEDPFMPDLEFVGERVRAKYKHKLAKRLKRNPFFLEERGKMKRERNTPTSLLKDQEELEAPPISYAPQCLDMPNHFISSTGHYHPCCWIAAPSNLKSSPLALELERFHIGSNSFLEMKRFLKDIEFKKIMDSGSIRACNKFCAKKRDSVDTNDYELTPL